MNTTCRACLNYTDNGVRLLTLYKHFHYLPIMIWNCIGIRVSQCAYIYMHILYFSLLFFSFTIYFIFWYHFITVCIFVQCVLNCFVSSFEHFRANVWTEWINEWVSMWPVIALTQWYEFYVMCAYNAFNLYNHFLSISHFSAIVGKIFRLAIHFQF